MTAEELLALRKRLGWSKAEMARRLDISVSRLTDYEVGHTRGPKERPAPIPRLFEYALKYLVGDFESSIEWREVVLAPWHNHTMQPTAACPESN
jgi:transcriptional regulator with XRE-family HTH domain